MAGETRNRNALRSQRMLQQAFSELLAEKPFDKITVTDVTRRADLSRGTFYAHYDSTSDLLRAMIDEIMGKLFLVVDTAAATNFLDNPEPVIKMVTDYLTKDESLFRTLVGTRAADSFIVYMKRGVIDRLMEKRDAASATVDAAVLRVNVTYVVGGLVDLACAWLRGDLGDVSVEQASAQAAALVRSVSAG